MIFQLYSDIHLEMNSGYPEIPPKADYLILAGDIGNINKSNLKEFLQYCSNNWKEVFYIFGNHELYHSSKPLHVLKEKYQELCTTWSNIHLLDNSSYVLEDITIYGFTAWTKPIFESQDEACLELNDYNCIRRLSEKISIDDVAKMSSEEITHFRQFITNFTGEQCLIISHFPPISGSSTSSVDTTSNPIYNGDSLQKYFRWDNLLKEENIDGGKIKVWCGAHTHWSYDFMEDNIRYISNQIGYIDEGVQFNDGLFSI